VAARIGDHPPVVVLDPKRLVVLTQHTKDQVEAR
jgi:hypothetical protein